MSIRISIADLDEARTVALLDFHSRRAHAETPGTDGGHALPANALKADDITVWAAFDLLEDNTPVGTVALRDHGGGLGEVKAMHVLENRRGAGIADQLLDALMDHARKLGLDTIKLETHPGPYFAPAIAFYRRRGFVDCDPFADYHADPRSIFMAHAL